MIKILVVLVAIITIALAVYFIPTQSVSKNEKLVEAKEAISTLGNFAENHTKTAENMATFRSVFGDDKKSPEPNDVRQKAVE